MFRIKSSFLTLFVIFGVGLLLTGPALAQTAFVSGEDTRYLVAEMGEDDLVWQIPNGSQLQDTYGFIAGTTNFFIDIDLGNAATWVSATPAVTVTIDQAGGGADYTLGGTLSRVLVNGDATFRVSWDSVANPITQFAVATLQIDNLALTDVGGQAQNEGPVTVTLTTRDAFTGVEVDDNGSADTITLFAGKAFWEETDIDATDAEINTAGGRLNFNSPDGTVTDVGAKIDLVDNSGDMDIYDPDGILFTAAKWFASAVTTFDDGISLDGIDDFTAAAWMSGPESITMTVYDGTSNGLTITVDGTTSLAPRVIDAAVVITVTQHGTASVGTRTFDRGSGLEVSEWGLDAEVFFAEWLQSNTDAPDGSDSSGVFKSRIYITNHTGTAGGVQVRVMRSDRSGDATDTSADLGTTAITDLPVLPANGTLIIRWEDVLAIAAITTSPPDTTGGGNTAAEITVNVGAASCAYQTFHEDTTSSFFGTTNCGRLE